MKYKVHQTVYCTLLHNTLYTGIRAAHRGAILLVYTAHLYSTAEGLLTLQHHHVGNCRHCHDCTFCFENRVYRYCDTLFPILCTHSIIWVSPCRPGFIVETNVVSADRSTCQWVTVLMDGCRVWVDQGFRDGGGMPPPPINFVNIPL